MEEVKLEHKGVTTVPYSKLQPEERLCIRKSSLQVFLGLSRDASETVAGIARPFSYHELRRFRAAVYFPWDMGMLLFSELYAIGVPTFLPDRAWVVSIIKRVSHAMALKGFQTVSDGFNWFLSGL